MKLLRLSGDNADFEANFNEDILFPKNAKICLKNLSFKRIYEVLKITDTLFNFSADGENDITFNITAKNYTNTNYLEVLTELIILINKNIVMTNNGSFVGLQAQFRVMPAGNLFIEFLKSPVYLDQTYINANHTSGNVSMNRLKRIQKIDGAANSVDTEIPDRIYFDNDIQFTKGSGLFSCKIGKLINNGVDNHTGFFMGLATAPNGSGEVLYNIEIRRPTDPYTAISNGIVVNGIVLTPQNFALGDISANDIIEIEKNNGHISGHIRQVRGSTRLFHHQLSDIHQLRNLFPVYGVYGASTNTTLALCRMNIDPFVGANRELGEISTTYLTTQITTAFNSVANPLNKTLTATMPIAFQLFTNIEDLTDRNDTYWKFIGSATFNLNLEDENYVVELLNLEIESFDSTRQKRMNILATIPAENTDSGILNYDVNERICVSLSNTFDLQLRNIRARVLDKNLNPIITEGTAIMTILIE